MINGNDFPQRIARFIRQQNLLLKDALHLVALSGGADSVTLLLVLQQLGYRVEAVHCNFHLRGDESLRDAAFCAGLCEKQRVKLHVTDFDTRTYASEQHISVEMAAREQRYGYFEKLRKERGADTICVAHHRNDSVETFFLNLLRGTGIRGLTGISPKNGFVVRPLLCVSRREILDYLQHRGQDFVTDSTNLETDAVRNKIRLQLLPMMRELNPSIDSTVIKTASILSEVEAMAEEPLQAAVRKVIVSEGKATADASGSGGGGCKIDLNELKNTRSPQWVLWEILKKYGFSSVQTEEIYADLDRLSGKEWQSKNHLLVFHKGTIVIAPNEGLCRQVVLNDVNNETVVGKVLIKSRLIEIEKGFQLNKENTFAYLDYSHVSFPLTVRHAVKGDRFHPLGMKGSKLLSDFMTDCGMSVLEKRRQLVICDAANRVLWVVGKRIDDRFKITESTREVLMMEMTCM